MNMTFNRSLWCIFVIFIYSVVFQQLSTVVDLGRSIAAKEDASSGDMETYPSHPFYSSEIHAAVQRHVAGDPDRPSSSTRSTPTLATSAPRDDNTTTESLGIFSEGDFDDIATPSYHFVKLHQSEAFMWEGRQKRLCKRLHKEEQKHKNNRTVIYLGPASCKVLHKQHRHGNLLYGYYAMHVASLAHDVDFVFVCQEKEEYDNLFWWIQAPAADVQARRKLLRQHRSTKKDSNTKGSNAGVVSRSRACSGMGKNPLQYATPLAQRDLRRMAISIFGQRSTTFSSGLSSLASKPLLPPLFPKVELDAVAIHLRCGDVLSNLSADKNTNYGLLPFFVYRDMVEKVRQDTNDTIASIGIVTAPFQKERQRSIDSTHASKCQDLVETLRDYLQSHFPETRVTIRNSPDDTIPMIYSRLILAEQASICIRSTFCVFATLSSFAKKRIFLEGGVNYFVTNNLEEGLVVWNATETPFLFSHEVQELGGWNETKKWLLQNISTS